MTRWIKASGFLFFAAVGLTAAGCASPKQAAPAAPSTTPAQIQQNAERQQADFKNHAASGTPAAPGGH